MSPSSRALTAILALAVGLGTARVDASEGVRAITGSSFTFQGRLMDNGTAASGTYDLEFQLFDDNGAPAGNPTTISRDDVLFTDGIFTVELDFGAGAFDGQGRTVEVRVRPGASTGTYAALAPRQRITATPHALSLPPIVRSQPGGAAPNVIEGFEVNAVSPGVSGAAIGGGGSDATADSRNLVTDDFGTIAGGQHNQAGDAAGNTGDAANATVSGGVNNRALGAVSTIGGGEQNVANRGDAVIAGGLRNLAGRNDATASGFYSAVGGGADNSAMGIGSTIPGGEGNTASGDYSLAAGRHATAGHRGSFVFADAPVSGASFASTAAGQFLIRAAGGVGIGTNAPARMLHIRGDTGLLRVESTSNTVNPVLELKDGSPGQARLSAINFLRSDNSTPGQVAYDMLNNRMEFRVNSLERMRIDELGNVGIGDTTPDARLDVTGTASDVAIAISGDTSHATGTGVFGLASASSGATKGVNGRSASTVGYGVYGEATATTGSATGVVGESSSTSGYGVSGFAKAVTGQTQGVLGRADSTSGIGVKGFTGAATGSTIGVLGESKSSSGIGVSGTATSTTGLAFGVRGVAASSEAGAAGVSGTATSTTGPVYGVRGVTNSTSGEGAGVSGLASAGTGKVYGVSGGAFSGGGAGGLFTNTGDGGGAIELRKDFLNGDFIKAIRVPSTTLFRVNGAGYVFADGSYNCGLSTNCFNSGLGADLAERIDATEALEPGDVVTIDPGDTDRFRLSRDRYSTLVAGVVSTAPSITMGNNDLSSVDRDERSDTRPLLALVGRVPVKASAENGPIRVGDLLVASSTPGHAMRGGPNPPNGTVIGKALEALPRGKGQIRMLVTLH